MNLSEQISAKINLNNYEYSKHAVDQSIIRDISVQEIKEVFDREIEIIEKYPNDKYGPSCLILGFTISNRPLHIQFNVVIHHAQHLKLLHCMSLIPINGSTIENGGKNEHS